MVNWLHPRQTTSGDPDEPQGNRSCCCTDYRWCGVKRVLIVAAVVAAFLSAASPASAAGSVSWDATTVPRAHHVDVTCTASGIVGVVWREQGLPLAGTVEVMRVSDDPYRLWTYSPYGTVGVNYHPEYVGPVRCQGRVWDQRSKRIVGYVGPWTVGVV